MVLGLGHHHAIHHHAGHEHLARIERAVRAHPLHLRDHEAAGVLRGRRDGEVVERERLVLHGDVAVQVRGGAAKQRDRDREGLVEEPLLALDLHHAHQLVGGAIVDLAALLARIDERAQAHLGDGAGAMGADVAEEVVMTPSGRL